MATTSYPPHPAEGRRYPPFGMPEAVATAQWASTPTDVLVVPTPVVISAPTADRRQHWLAYDPSSRSQYPVD